MALLKDHEEIWMTGEELLRRPDLEPCELINGRVVPTMPTGRGHGSSEAKITTRLTTYAEATGRGAVMTGEVGIYIRRDPDTVRAADILFISRERLARCAPSGYLDVAPELVVEVFSPTDRWSKVVEKLEDYFAAGVDRVWVLMPDLRRVLAYRSPVDVVQFGEGEILTDEEILSGFSVLVAELFPG
jgi:Uma2 family endonuclease